MFTIIVLEDEERVHKLITDSLSREGYLVTNQPHTQGMIKVVRKSGISKDKLLSGGFLDMTDILIKHRSGQIYKTLLSEVEKPLIEQVLKRTEGNKLKAARMLGINRNTLDAKIKKLEIDANRFKL